MRYIKTFESFKINEEVLDFMTFPADVDFAKGSADMWNDIYDSIKNSVIKPAQNWLESKGEQIVESIKPSQESLKKIYDFMMKTFGTTNPELNKENVNKAIVALELDKIKESNVYQQDEWHTKEGENIFIKILAALKYIFGLNIAGWFGAPAFFAGLAITGGSGSMAALVWLGSFVITWILIKILKLFGYSDDDTAAVGYYDKDKDIRNKF